MDMEDFMNIFFRELRAYRKSLIFWCLGMVFLVVSGMGKYSSYSGSSQSLKELMSSIPKSIQALMGMGDFDVTTLGGFFGMLYLYILIMITIHAVTLGANIISKEERDKTAEFLMVKPVSRTKILTAKLLAAVLNITILNVVTFLFSIFITGKYSKGENINGEIFLMLVGTFFLQLLFLSVGSGIAAIGKNPKTSGTLATAILLVTFIISAVVDLNSNLWVLKYVTPFKYFDAGYIINNASLNPLFVIISLFVVVLMIVSTYSFYKKRDLKI